MEKGELGDSGKYGVSKKVRGSKGGRKLWNGRGVWVLGVIWVVAASLLWAIAVRAGGMGPEQDDYGQGNGQGNGQGDRGRTRATAGQQQRGGMYPADVVNHPYPYTPKYVWRGMFSGIQERIDAERHAIGVSGRAAQELAYYQYAERHPNQVRHEVGRVIDSGVHYLGGGWTRLDTTRGTVKVYNPRFDPLVSTVAPANRAAVQEIEQELDCQLGREAPGYYNERGMRVPKGDPSAVRLVGTAPYRR